MHIIYLKKENKEEKANEKVTICLFFMQCIKKMKNQKKNEKSKSTEIIDECI